MAYKKLSSIEAGKHTWEIPYELGTTSPVKIKFFSAVNIPKFGLKVINDDGIREQALLEVLQERLIAVYNKTLDKELLTVLAKLDEAQGLLENATIYPDEGR
jgi:hypothetical protein